MRNVSSAYEEVAYSASHTEVGRVVVQTQQRPVVPFVLSLIGGLLILSGGGLTMGFSGPGYDGGMMSGYYGMMMSEYYGMMGGYGSGRVWGLAVISVISGILVLLGAVMIYNNPEKAATWGALILVFSAVSLFGMGGFFVGAILGIVGGILGVTWKRVIFQPHTIDQSRQLSWPRKAT